MGEDWEYAYCPGTHLLSLFSREDTYYWTVLPETQQELAPIYCSDEADFATASAQYPSLTAFIETKIPRIKFVWKID
jgi:nitrous oxide reductase accessory protein NosL